MRSADLLLYLKYSAVVYAASDTASRPRGVGPELADFYKDKGTFSCISHPSIQLPFARVNDDYCDCPDGSDEPGTAACAHISTLSPRTPADGTVNFSNASRLLPGFYCQNEGHIPLYVPFISVNDGICDYELCCDGSEEWEGVGGVKCENRCKEIGKEYKKKEEARQKALGSAAKKRKELVAQAAKIKQELQGKVKKLQKEVDEADQQVKRLEHELSDTEKRDRGKVVHSPEGSKGGKLSVLISQGQKRTDELREVLKSVREERDDFAARLQELETLLDTFKKEYNPNFNDEGVKRAVRAWDDYFANRGGDFQMAWEDEDLDGIVAPDAENGLDWESYYEAEDETDVLYGILNYLPPSLREWVDSKLRDLRVKLVGAGILADRSSGGGETRAVTDARNRLDAAKRDRENSRNELDTLNEELTREHGPDDVFRALKGTCVSTDSGEYTYELCFLEQTLQKPKKGGGGTNMGKFTRFETMMVDEALPADGKGLGSGERYVMKHEMGQSCWNGPSRSTTVILACAEENEVWKIMEMEKCVYRMEVGTPAVCDNKSVGGSGKDEL